MLSDFCKRVFRLLDMCRSEKETLWVMCVDLEKIFLQIQKWHITLRA